MFKQFLAICMIVSLAHAAENTNNNKESTDNQKNLQRGKNGGREFPPFNAEGGIIAPPPLPGYQEPLPFNPYASPQLNYPGIYPSFPPQQPQGYPIQPQILYYSGAGQPFLVNPGNPPGNFLVPQPLPPQAQPVDPNIYRNQPGYPQNPVFVAGYPKPAHVPPIEKDAEEIPKSTTQQANPSTEKKPQKIELDDAEDEPAKPTQRPSVIPEQPPRNLLNIRPGQRFFILNGQPLFTNYPPLPYQTPVPGPERFVQPYIVNTPSSQNLYAPTQQQTIPSQSLKPIGPLAHIILRNQPHVVQQYLIPQQFKDQKFVQQPDGLPLTLHNQVVDKDVQSVLLASPSSKNTLQSRYHEKTIPFDNEQVQPIFDSDGLQYDYYKYTDDAGDDAAIIIDAKYQEPNEVESDDAEGETEKPAESSVAEAQPGAIALAGDGGVAAAGPRGTALAGAGGLAVSSPHATAVAGPSKDDHVPVHGNDKNKKPTEKPKQ